MLSKYLNKIICKDALDQLKELPTDSIDTIITDPDTCKGDRIYCKIYRWI